MQRFIRLKNKKCFMFFTIFILFFGIFSNSTIIADDEKRPDLIISSFVLPEDIIEGENIEFVTKIKNQGNINISASKEIGIALKIDGSLVSSNSTNLGLAYDSTIFLNLSWIPTYSYVGSHLLSVEVDYKDKIIETNENNNARDSNIEVLEREAKFEILNLIPTDSFSVNKTVRIDSEIKNNGTKSDKIIFANLSSNEEGIIGSIKRNDSLDRNEIWDLSFNFTPKIFGSQVLTLNVIYYNKTHDTFTKSINVEIQNLNWFNSSWHYRYFLTINGSGIYSESFNFTKLLEDIGLFSEVFEHDTLRIVKYNRNGEILDIIDDFFFNESENFHPVDNATGELFWRIEGPSQEKYYCIYFDVLANFGNRDSLIEDEGIIESGDCQKGSYYFVEAWFSDITSPLNNSHAILGNLINISASTVAKSRNVSAFIYLNSNISYNFTIYLDNVNNYTTWSFENFDFSRAGDWTIILNCIDWAGYQAETVKHLFYVGKPDLILDDISYSTDWLPTSPKIYKDDSVNITAHIFSINATLDNINVSLSLRDSSNNEVLNLSSKNIIYIDKENKILFSWNANISGTFHLIIEVDSEDIIDEENEDNNKIIDTIIVYEWPDLKINDINFPTMKKTEFERIDFDLTVENIGNNSAIGYKIGLYLENESDEVMSYSNLLDYTYVTLKKNSALTVRLTWDSAEVGDWLVAAQVIVNDTKKDSDKSNNRFLSENILLIKSNEKDIPTIQNVRSSPNDPQQGETVTITADVKDFSGLSSVKIKIIDPLNNSYSGNMAKDKNNIFKFYFMDTIEIGIYDFEIIATDDSYYLNQARKEYSFRIYEDEEPPIISFVDTSPRVQLKDKELEIICTAKDNIRVWSVKIYLIYPEGNAEELSMNKISDGKYVYSNIYEDYGKYNFYIEVSDAAGNSDISSYHVFWISSDLEDTDNDGLPDTWEERYGLDPENPEDAKFDLDGDGLINSVEYAEGTNPTKDILFENFVYRIKENMAYLISSIILFLLIIFLILFIKRRT